MMSDQPDYTEYSLSELLDIKNHIDAYRYPDRAAAVDHELEQRLGTVEPDSVPILDESPGIANEPLSKEPRRKIDEGPLLGRFYAGFGERLGADLLDGIYIVLLSLPVYFFLDKHLLGIESYFSLFEDDGPVGVTNAVVIILILYNMTYLVGRCGQSWGRRSVGIVVVDYNGKPIGFLKALGRNLFAAFVSSVLYLGFLWILWDSRGQALHDKIFGTLVVSSTNEA